MSLQKITQVSGLAAVLPGNDIDTDRIIPARFLKCVTFEGLGEKAFFDERFDAQGKPLPHALNDRPQATVLVAGANFGCGSSREHAPQALYHWGLRAILAESFAEIFFGNSTAIGLACVTLTPADLATVRQWVFEHPREPVQIDLEKSLLTMRDKKLAIQVPESARRALCEGRWDPLAELLAGAATARALDARLRYPSFS